MLRDAEDLPLTRACSAWKISDEGAEDASSFVVEGDEDFSERFSPHRMRDGGRREFIYAQLSGIPCRSEAD